MKAASHVEMTKIENMDKLQNLLSLIEGVGGE